MTTKAKSIKGTETEKNLVKSYMAESAAYTRYTSGNKGRIFPYRRSIQ